MKELQVIGLILIVVTLSVVGAVVGMVIGAVILPMRILEGNIKRSDIQSILTKTDPNKDQI